MERDERDSTGSPMNGGYSQVYDVAKGANPLEPMGTRGVEGGGTGQGEDAGMVSGSVGRIRKGLDPPFDGLWGKVDLKEKVSSSAWGP